MTALPRIITRKPSFYYDYIRSLAWRIRRLEYLRRVGWRCERCYVGKAIIVHHLGYECLGHEQPQDLMALCHRCHSEMHTWPPRAANDNQLILDLKDTG
jgi:5-methylcytosine-specific restriction endonuclease McrA